MEVQPSLRQPRTGPEGSPLGALPQRAGMAGNPATIGQSGACRSNGGWQTDPTMYPESRQDDWAPSKELISTRRETPSMVSLPTGRRRPRGRVSHVERTPPRSHRRPSLQSKDHPKVPSAQWKRTSLSRTRKDNTSRRRQAAGAHLMTQVSDIDFDCPAEIILTKTATRQGLFISRGDRLLLREL